MNKKAALNLQESRDIGQVLNATFAFIGLTFKALYRDILLITGPFFILAGVFTSLSAYNIISSISLARAGVFSSYQFFSPVYWLSLLCLLIGWSLSTSIIGNHVLQYKLNGVGYSAVEARKGIKQDIMRVIFGNFINLLVIIAACFLFIIPGIYLAVANSLLTTIIILDKQTSILDAFSDSRRLIRDNWWAALGLGIIVGIITYVIELIFKMPSSILSGIIAFNHIRNGNDASSFQLLFTVLSSIAYIGVAVVSPISVVASCIYYYSLKEKKDHSALLQNIDNIGVATANPQTDTHKDEGDF